jgi:hypothetical protein
VPDNWEKTRVSELAETTGSARCGRRTNMLPLTKADADTIGTVLVITETLVEKST